MSLTELAMPDLDELQEPFEPHGDKTSEKRNPANGLQPKEESSTGGYDEGDLDEEDWLRELIEKYGEDDDTEADTELPSDESIEGLDKAEKFGQLVANEDTRYRRPGAGQKGKGKLPNNNGQAAQTVATEQVFREVEKSKEQRAEEAGKQLLEQLNNSELLAFINTPNEDEKLVEEIVEVYAEWVLESVLAGIPTIIDRDIEMEEIPETNQYQAKHIYSSISAVATEGFEQAEEQVRQNLTEHIETWGVFIGNTKIEEGNITEKRLKAIRAKTYELARSLN